MNKSILLLTTLTLYTVLSFAQSASVSPSRLYFNVPVGEYRTQTIRVTNTGSSAQSFTISFGDFETRGIEGKSELLPSGESPNSCARYLSASPSFFEVAPGEGVDVQILLQLPNTPDANRVKWATIIVKLAAERTAPQNTDGQMGIGILQTFQFVLHVFQTPPTITHKSAQILHFRDVTAAGDTVKRLEMLVENDGEGIIDCASYIELTNLNTGYNQRLKVIAYTILPKGRREIFFNLPANIPAGMYSILGVVDYGSRDEIVAAELEMQID